MPIISSKAIYWGKTLSKFISVQIVIQALTFTSGILIIHTLDKQQYAYFTIANTMQGAMNTLADNGISIGLLTIGGKVWHDKYRFGQLINTALQLRIYQAVVSVAVVTPILLWVLISNKASVIYALFITAAVLLGLNSQLTIGVLDVVPLLHSQIARVQKLELIPAFFRLILLGIAYFIFLNTAVAILIGSISYVLKRFILSRWVTDSIDLKASINKKDHKEILSIIKSQIPNTVFYCLQGQFSILLISIFGDTSSIAEVGALGRLVVIFSIVNSVLGGIVLPSFARCQSINLLSRRYWQILGIFSFIGLLIIIITIFFPNQILLILGKNYEHLQNELVLIAISTVFSSLIGTMWSINATKAWIQYSWLNIPGTIITQIFLLLILDVSSVEGVIWFGILSNIPAFIVNAFLTYKGLFSYSSKIL